MSEQHSRVTSGAPQQMAPDPDAGAPAEPAQEEAGPAQRVKQAAAPAREKAREVAGGARFHAQAAAGQAKDQAVAQVDEKSTQAGRQIGAQGEALEGVAGELRKQGRDGPAKVAEQAAEKVRNVGEHLEHADGQKLVDAAQQVARDNPAAAAAVGGVAGFAAGRVIKAVRDDGDDDAQRAPGDAGRTVPGQPGTGAA